MESIDLTLWKKTNQLNVAVSINLIKVTVLIDRKYLLPKIKAMMFYIFNDTKNSSNIIYSIYVFIVHEYILKRFSFEEKSSLVSFTLENQ